MKLVATNLFKQALHKFPVENQSLLGWYKIVADSNFDSALAVNNTFGTIDCQNDYCKFPIPDSSLMVHVKFNFDSQVALIVKIKPGQL